jgi:hypothetical protein
MAQKLAAGPRPVSWPAPAPTPPQRHTRPRSCWTPPRPMPSLDPRLHAAHRPLAEGTTGTQQPRAPQTAGAGAKGRCGGSSARRAEAAAAAATAAAVTHLHQRHAGGGPCLRAHVAALVVKAAVLVGPTRSAQHAARSTRQQQHSTLAGGACTCRDAQAVAACGGHGGRALPERPNSCTIQSTQSTEAEANGLSFGLPQQNNDMLRAVKGDAHMFPGAPRPPSQGRGHVLCPNLPPRSLSQCAVRRKWPPPCRCDRQTLQTALCLCRQCPG